MKDDNGTIGDQEKRERDHCGHGQRLRLVVTVALNLDLVDGQPTSETLLKRRGMHIEVLSFGSHSLATACRAVLHRRRHRIVPCLFFCHSIAIASYNPYFTIIVLYRAPIIRQPLLPTPIRTLAKLCPVESKYFTIKTPAVHTIPDSGSCSWLPLDKQYRYW